MPSPLTKLEFLARSEIDETTLSCSAPLSPMKPPT